MPAVLNSVATQPTYADALTVIFARPRKSFSLNVLNAQVMYQLRFKDPGRGISMADPGDWEATEHQLPPSFNRFADAEAEGLGPGAVFTGIRLRSVAVDAPAIVTVI